MIDILISKRKKLYLYDQNDIFLCEGIISDFSTNGSIKIEVFSDFIEGFSLENNGTIVAKDKNECILFSTKLMFKTRSGILDSTGTSHLYLKYPDNKKIYENRYSDRDIVNLKGTIEEENPKDVFVFNISTSGIGFVSQENYSEHTSLLLSLEEDDRMSSITIVRKKIVPVTDTICFYEYGAKFAK